MPSRSTSRGRHLIAAGALLSFSMPAASAADFDGSRPLICSSVELYSCAASSGCQKETAESLDAPEFMSIDVPGKLIDNPRPSGAARKTPIEAVRQLADRLLLSGVDGDAGWNLEISGDGKMTLNAVVADEDKSLAITVFGACMPR